jgi:hypothetical protein
MEKDLTVFSVHRKLILLAKTCLDSFRDLDELNQERKEKLKRILEDFPECEKEISDVLDLYEPVSVGFLERSRKKILDKANELSREFETDFNKGIR